MTRTAASVGVILRRAGILTGYRYTQTGYNRSDGSRATEPGCEITRTKRARYGGTEDAGAVFVYPIDPSKSDGSVEPEYVERVVAALTAAGLPIDRIGALSIKIADPEEHHA